MNIETAIAGMGVEMAAVDDERLAWLELNDLGNAERLKARFGATLAWLPMAQCWAAFDGRHWSATDGARRASLAAYAPVRALRDEAEALEGLAAAPDRWWPSLTADMIETRMVRLREWRVKAGNSNRLGGMLKEAANLMTVADELFDADPLALNVMNGTLRFAVEAGEFRVMFSEGHDPADRITRLARTVYDPRARAPKWLAHLETCLPDPEVRKFYQTAHGYTMTALTDEQCVFLCQGRGGDGKSTAQQAIQHTLGSYAIAASVNTFISSGSRGQDASGPSPDMARLAGDSRLVIAGEPKKGSRLDDGRIKLWTSSGEVVARKLHKDDFPFRPRGKLWFECNGRPEISGDDDGIWRRIVLFLWTHQFGDAKVIGFEKQLFAEAPGILNWLIEGLARWMLDGRLKLPEGVTQAVAEYRRANNHFGEWLKERTLAEPGASTLSKELYGDYKAWCERNDIGERDMLSSTKFGLELGDRQFLVRKNGKGNIERRGLRLKAPADEFAERAEDEAAMAAYDDLAAEYGARGDD